MNNERDKLIIDINLAGMYSDDSFTRELSIFQLQNYLNHARVVSDLEKALEREVDPELKSQLQSLIELGKLEKSQPLNGVELESNQQAPDSIWQTQPDFSVDELLARLKNFESTESVELLRRIIENEVNPIRLIPFFSKAHPLLQNEKVVRSFAGKLNSNDEVFLIRLIAFLNRTAPEYILKQFQFLLAHKNFNVRVLTLRTLYRFYPNEAIRLLNELIIVRKSNLAACNLLFLFPFAEVSDIVLKLLENGALQDLTIRKAVENLVLNNPDPDFFSLLVRLEILRGEELPGLKELREKALDGLELAGIITENRNSFLQKAFVSNNEYLQKETGIEIKQQPAAAKAEPDDSPDEKLESFVKFKSFLEKDALSAVDKQDLQQVLLSKKQPVALAFKVVKKFNLKDDFVKSWLEDKLFAADCNHRILAMQLLAEKDFSLLLPHLPVLCLDSQSQISLNSIRLFRKFGEKKLLRWLDKWLKEDTQKTWQAALAGLLQVNADESKAILLKHLAATKRVSFIRYFSPVFTFSPDFRTLHQLEKIFECSRESKREALQEQIALLQQALAKTDSRPIEAAAQITRDRLKEKWQDISETLKNFSYLTDENELVENILIFLQKQWLTICLIIMGAGLFLLYWHRTTTNLPVSKTRKSQEIRKSLQKLPPLASGTIKFMTLNKYDPINQFWESTGSDGTRYKLKLIKPERFSPGFKGNFQVSSYRISFSGYPVVTCKYIVP